MRDKHSLLIELSALVEGGGEEVAVEVLDVPELRLAATIRHRPSRRPRGRHGDALPGARLAARARDLTRRDRPTALFRTGDGNGTHLVEAGFPVGPGVVGDGAVAVTVYAAARAATVMHLGSFDGLHVTAQRFISTVLGQGLRFGQAIRIEYVELDARARIVWPLAPS